ncbi:hypothetical protein BH09MYX1_BH09MYX1_44330 [soil metagenome]
MRKIRLVVSLSALGFGLVGAVVAACGGSDATICGPGTTSVGGICQVSPVDGSTVDGTTTDVEVPDGTAIEDSGVDAVVIPVDAGDGAVAPNRCPYGKGPVMAEIPNPGADAGSFCIDSTEVTEAQYDQFLKDKNGNTGGQILDCSWNQSWQPGYDKSACPNYVYVYNPGTNPNRPVRCVDWCDAKVFCEWSGKKLCGQLDGSNSPTRGTSRWYWTCTNGNATAYPQGSQTDNTCHMPSNADAGVVNVGSVGCKGKFPPFSETNDLLGNVTEWQAYCAADGGGLANCATYGGSYLNNNFQGCDDNNLQKPLPRYASGNVLGIRCCAD